MSINAADGARPMEERPDAAGDARRHAGSLAEALAGRLALPGRQRARIAVASTVLTLAGIALLIVGLVGDARGWWSDRPFLTNVFSAGVGACFGLPLAVVVLRAINDRQAREAAAYRVASETSRLLLRLRGNADRIDQYWIGVALHPDGTGGTADSWSDLHADLKRVLAELRSGSSFAAVLAVAVPLGERFTRVGMGNVRRAAREMQGDFAALRRIGDNTDAIRDWDSALLTTRSVDVRSFEGVLDALTESDSYRWCNALGRMHVSPATLENEPGWREHLLATVTSGLRLMNDAGIVVRGIIGEEDAPSVWREARATYTQILRDQFRIANSR